MENLILVRIIKETDKDWIRSLMIKSWGSEVVIASKPFNTMKLPGFIAEIDGKLIGVLTYNIANEKCEIVSLNSSVEGKGIGTALIKKVKKFAKEKNYKCILLVTSNDNIDAFRFYQKKGFRIIKIYPNAIEEARKLKPQIPKTGYYEIPMKDAIELEHRLS